MKIAKKYFSILAVYLFISVASASIHYYHHTHKGADNHSHNCLICLFVAHFSNTLEQNEPASPISYTTVYSQVIYTINFKSYIITTINPNAPPFS